MPIKMTDQAINKATKEAETSNKRLELSDQTCPGLRIRITPTGKRSWVLGMRDQLGNPRRYPLGEYPLLGISDAREAARAMSHKVKHEAADPIAAKRRKLALGKDARAGVGTLRALLDVYEKSSAAPKSWKRGRPRVEALFKPLLDKPAPLITLIDLQSLVDNHPNPKSAAFVVRTFRPVLTWASKPGRAFVSVELARISSSAETKPRRRILSEPELRAVLPILREDRPHSRLMRFLLLTLARRDEAATAKWRNVSLDTKTWTIPETKNGEPHLVPLSRQAVALLQAIGPKKPDELVFRSSNGTRLGNWDRVTKSIVVRSGLAVKDDKSQAVTMKDGSPIWTRHDLRRTGATMLGEMGVLPAIIEAALNHAIVHSALAATYNLSRYRPEVAKALQQLADRLDEIEHGPGVPPGTPSEPIELDVVNSPQDAA